MQLTLYKDFKKRKNSTKLPGPDVWQVTAETTLKHETSLENPTFLIDGTDLDMPHMNYAYFNGRYYFIRERVYYRDQLFELNCETDPLATFKNNVLNYIAFVERAASAYDPWINDAALSSEQRIVYSAEASTSVGFSSSTLHYLVRVIGKGSPGSGTSAEGGGTGGGGREGGTSSGSHDYTGTDLFVLTKSQFNRLMDFAFTSGNFPVDEITDDLKKLIFNPFQYIVQVMVLPHDLSGTTFPDQREIYLGYYPTGVTAPLAPKKLNQYINLNMPVPYYKDDFRRFNPSFSAYNMYLPCVGTIPLQPADINTTLSINFTLDFQTGNVFYVLGRGANVIATYSGQAAIPMQISQLAPVSASIMSMASTALTAGAGIATGNPAVAVGAIAGGDVLNTATAITAPTPSINGTAGNLANILQFPDVFISMSAYESAEFPIAHYGRPYCKNVQLGTLSGFVKCAGASLDVPGSSADKDAVNSYLNTGFYIE